MKAVPDPAGARLWAIVSATVRPLPGRLAAAHTGASPLGAATVRHHAAKAVAAAAIGRPAPRLADPTPLGPPQAIEPGRHRRLTRGGRRPAAVLDLHGLGQDLARAALTQFVTRAHANGHRLVLVITGKGALGDGVSRRRVPEWLGQQPLRA